MIEYKKSTDNTHPIDLQSAINSVYCRADVICAEEEAFFDVVTELVADNSDIEIEIKDADGAVIHALKEKIKENFLKSSFKIPADATGKLTINAKLPAHSLEKESAPVEILAQPEITDAKWAKTEAEAAECIDFSATTKNINEYSDVTIEVYKQESGKEELLESFAIQAGQDKLEGTWQEEGECELVETQEEADKLVPAEYFYKAKYKNVEAKSDALKINNYIIQEPPPEAIVFEMMFTNDFSNVECANHCSVKFFKIGCGHTTGEKPSRNFKLDLETGKPTRDGQHVYQMISGSTGLMGDKENSIDSIDFEYKVHDCINFLGDECAKIKVDGQTLETSEPGKASKKLPSVEGLTPKNILEFLKIATPSRIKPAAHEIQVSTCEGEDKTATVEVYPSVGWKGDISFGYTQSAKIEYDKDSGYNKTNRESPFAITGEIAGHYNNLEWKVGGSHSKESVFPTLDKFFNHVMPFFEQLGEAAEHDTSTKAVTVDIKWPHYTMGGKIDNAENPDGYDVYTKGEFNVGFNPFIGAEVKVNILPILLKAAKGAGPIGIALVEFLELAMKKCAKGVGGDSVNLKAELALTLTIKAGIKGDLKWEFTPGKVSESGKVNGELGITFEGKANIETKVFIANISAGVLAGIKSAVGADLSAKTSEGKPQFGGKLYFKGITVYYSYYYEVKKAKLEQMDNNAMPTVKPKAEIKDEYDHEFVWIEPIEKEFPEKEKVADQSLAG